MFLLLIFLNFVASEPLYRIDVPRLDLKNGTRRILKGKEVGETRPYMVYLRPASSAVDQIEQEWLCGGVIIDERYILTSAACIEDVEHFYVIAGTHKWISPKAEANECITNGQKKAVWKCVPKTYVYDGAEFDNIRWMMNDIAVVKVEDDFNFDRRIKGCDFIPQKVSYNNQSIDLEKPKTFGSVAGWGSDNLFSDIIGSPVARAARNQEELLEADVIIISKPNCKKRWHERYHHVIDHFMICGKDSMDAQGMSPACDHEVNCKELEYADEDDDARRTIVVPNPERSTAQSGTQIRRSKIVVGGFCENDHGGPLIVGHGKTAVVVGVISANQVQEKTHLCHGPFLYTSVWNNRHLIGCAIEKAMGVTCRRLLRASRTQMSESFFTWRAHPDGPSKDEMEEETKKNTHSNEKAKSSNKTTKRNKSSELNTTKAHSSNRTTITVTLKSII